MKTGDPIILIFDECKMPGWVLLASPNGRSLMVTFDGMIGGYLGIMPLLQEDDGYFYDLIEHKRIQVVPTPATM